MLNKILSKPKTPNSLPPQRLVAPCKEYSRYNIQYTTEKYVLEQNHFIFHVDFEFKSISNLSIQSVAGSRTVCTAFAL